MLKKFGCNAVYMDSTHKTNAYDFFLTTLLIIDDYGEGIPVGWMVSNKEEKLMIICFLQAIRKKSGVIHPHWFMSDDAEQYYSAWTYVFGIGGTKKVLCAWHVDRVWRKDLNLHIKSQTKRIEIYHQLRILLAERTESQFRVMLQEFLTYIHKYYIEFYIYFSTYYCKRVEQWASCYR